MKFEGYCSNPNCGKWGHWRTDCWKEGGGVHGKGKDKDKGKSKEEQGKTKGKGRNANSMETGENWSEPQQQNLQQPVRQTAAGSLTLCSLENCCTVSHQRQLEQWEKIDLTLGSGSAVSACPEYVGEVFGFASPASGFKYVTADGRASVQDKGGRRLHMVTEMGTQVNMNMRVAGVHKALVAASDVTDQGDVVTLSKFGSFVEHHRRGRIHRAAHKASSSAPEFWLYKTNGVYTFPVWFWDEHQTSAQAGASICPVAAPAAATAATSPAAVQGSAASSAAVQRPMAASSPSPTRAHELEGSQVGFLRQVMRL